MACRTPSSYTPPVRSDEDPQVVQEYNRKKLEQPMEQPDKQIVYYMLDMNDAYMPVFNMTREKAEQLISRHKDFIIFIRIDQQAINDVKYRIRCLKVAWSYKDNKALTGYVFEQDTSITLDPECGIKSARVLMSLNIEDAYRISGPYILSGYPIKAYLIGGHGEQIRPSSTESGYFIVPYNCTIVVKGHSGDIQWADPAYKQFIELIKMGNLTKMPFLMIKDLIKKVGSVSIYGPGDKCPEFNYTLNSQFSRSGLRTSYLSGLVDFDCHKDMKNLPPTMHNSKKLNDDRKKIIKGNNEQIKSYYLDQYKWSVYPTQNKVELIVDNNPGNFYSIDEELNKIDIKQSALCKLFPGVYYNFVCRSIEGTTGQLFNTQNTTNNNKKERIVSYRVNNNTIKEIEHKKKIQNEHIKVFSKFLNEYPQETNENKKKQLSNEFMSYLEKDLKQSEELKQPYEDKLTEVMMKYGNVPEKKPNQTNENYEKNRVAFDEKLDKERDKMLEIYTPLSEDWELAASRYGSIQAEGIDNFIEKLKEDLAKYKDKYKLLNIKNFAFKNRISEAVGHRRSAIRNAAFNKRDKTEAEQNKEVMNRVKASSNRRAAQQKALENANHAEYNRTTKKNNAQKNHTTLKNGKPNIRPTPIINTRTMAPAAGGRRSTKKKRSS